MSTYQSHRHRSCRPHESFAGSVINRNITCQWTLANGSKEKQNRLYIAELTSSSVKSSPRDLIIWRNSSLEIFPDPSLSKTLKASRISASLSAWLIFRAIRVTNSAKSIRPLPSASTSEIICCNSPSVGFWPMLRITVPSSATDMLPSLLSISMWRNVVRWVKYVLVDLAEMWVFTHVACLDVPVFVEQGEGFTELLDGFLS